MKSNRLFATAALVMLVSVGAHADDAVAPEYTKAFQGGRARADVVAEAAQVALNRSTEPAGSRVLAPVRSSVDRASVRSQAAEALRLGKILSAEAGAI